MWWRVLLCKDDIAWLVTSADFALFNLAPFFDAEYGLVVLLETGFD
jgi:hypothetical protein